jgi:hypothetical protein
MGHVYDTVHVFSLLPFLVLKEYCCMLTASNAVLVFLKSLATPVVLYTANGQEMYQEMKTLMKNAKPGSPKLVEKETLGPLKQVFFWDTEIVGAALQVEAPSGKVPAALPNHQHMGPLTPKATTPPQLLP